MARPSLKVSLRKCIIADLKKKVHDLEVISEKKKGRPKGWTKIKAKDLHGALNVSWQPISKTLTVRAIGKQGNNSGDLVGRFVAYLLQYR